jgi:hypothetical protein
VATSFAELDDQFTQFIQQEDQTLWDQGDALVAYNPTDAEFEKLAEHHNRSVATLRTRMRVANEFKPGNRDAGSFYVYVHLLKIHDPLKRASILAEKNLGDWTVDGMAARVAQYLRDTGATRRVYEMRRAGMRLGDYRVTGELDDNGLMLTVSNGDLTGATVTHQPVGNKIVVHIAQ